MGFGVSVKKLFRLTTIPVDVADGAVLAEDVAAAALDPHQFVEQPHEGVGCVGEELPRVDGHGLHHEGRLLPDLLPRVRDQDGHVEPGLE